MNRVRNGCGARWLGTLLFLDADSLGVWCRVFRVPVDSAAVRHYVGVFNFDVMSGEGVPAVRKAVVASVIGLFGAVLIGAFLVLISRVIDVDGEVFTREPQALGDLAWYAGFLSTLGALIWFGGASAVVALAFNGPSRPVRAAYIAASVVAAAMALDDIYLLHDEVYPLPESVVQFGYFVGIFAVVWGFRAVLPSAAVVGSIGAVGLWVASAAVDVLFNTSAINLDQLTEDTFKFAGIVVWTVGWVMAARASAENIPSADAT